MIVLAIFLSDFSIVSMLLSPSSSVFLLRKDIVSKLASLSAEQPTNAA
jgi:hypothetical protein